MVIPSHRSYGYIGRSSSEQLRAYSRLFPMRWLEGHTSQGSRVLRFCHFELEQSSCSSKFGCSSLMKHLTPQAVCSLIVMRKNLRIFMTTIRSDFIEYFTFHFVNYCRLWSLMVCELWWFVIFDSFSLVQPIRLLNHSNVTYKSIDMPIHCCSLWK